ncbi:hypothetical protein ACWDF9_28295 [Streptomyces rubiginosohelvolus]
MATGIDVAGRRAAAAEVGPEEFLPWYEEQLAGATDTDERAQLQELRDWVAAGNSPDSRWSALQLYDTVLAELPGPFVLFDDDDGCLRTRIGSLLTWFSEFSTTSLARLLVLAAHEKDPVTAPTALLAAGLVGPSATAEDITPRLKDADPLMRWAAASALIRLAALDKAPVGPGLIGRAVTELTAAARSPFDRVTDYCEGDLHRHIQRTRPPGSHPAAVRALDEVGCALLSALQDWARDSPVTAAPGIARSIIRLTVNVVPEPEHPDTADTLEAMCDEHLVLAHAVHSAPGAHHRPLGGRAALDMTVEDRWPSSRLRW